MKTFTSIMAWAVITLFAVSTAYGQTVSVGSGSGAPGEQVTVQLDWDNNGNAYRTLQLDVTFDNTALSAVDTGNCPVEPYITGYLVSTCSQRAAPNDNQVRLGLTLITGAIPTGNLGELVFTIAGAATPGTVDLTISGVVIEGDPTPTINNGTITINGPDYSSSPAPGTIDFGSVQTGGTNPSQDVTITNAGPAGTLLDVTCVESPDTTAFIVSNGTATDIASGANHVVTVSCNAALAPNTYTGSLSCTHNGDGTTESSPAEYPLTCTVTPGPEPAYGSTPAPGATINMSAAFQDDPIADETISISNTGDSGTTLSGTCSIAGAPEITMTGDGTPYSVLQGAAPVVRTLSCDSSAEGDYSATVSCTHNGSNIASPATYDVNCSVGPQRPAVFASSPAAGTTTPMTSGTGVPVGATAPQSVLQISNTAVSGANDLGLTCSASGSAEITASPDLSGGTTVSPGAGQAVTFTCATGSAGSYSTTYSCDYDLDGADTSDGSASYTYTCDVREAEATVTTNPAGGTTLSAQTEIGGTAQLSVVFSESADEGVDAALESCTLTDGTNFSIVSPATFPAAIAAGGSVTVTVEGGTSDEVDSITDTLTCAYSDSGSGDGPTEVVFPLEITFGSPVQTFLTSVTFTNGNTASATATLTCNTGIPLTQSFDISEGSPVTFTMTELDTELTGTNCEITLDGVDAAYTVSASANSGAAADSCVFEAGDFSDDGANTCEFTATPNESEFAVEIDFDSIDDPSIDLGWDLEVVCTPAATSATSTAFPGVTWNETGTGSDELLFTFFADPEDGSDCTATLDGLAMAIEQDGPCTIEEIAVGEADDPDTEESETPTCVITATAFFEGIPTLSQYGLALMALLMLGFGMVGMRRFT